jgi:hypothetical protein
LAHVDWHMQMREMCASLVVLATTARYAARHRTDDEDGGQPLTTMSKEEEMIRWLWLLLPALLLGPASLATLWLAVGPGHEQAGAVYSVQEVQLGLAHDPAAWLGRTLRVRGMVYSASCSCRDRAPSLFDRDGASMLHVAGWEPDPLLAALRRLPLVGGLVPGPQVARGGVLATYRVRLLAAPAATCDAVPCYQAMLLDAAP